MASPPEPETQQGQIIAERYRLIEMLATGGMGTVWVAHDEKLAREVALKVMHPKSLEAFPDARERFEREARAAATLRSSHVVSVFDYGVEQGLPFIAMELLEGESLKDRLERVGAFSVQQSGEMLRQVAKGLKAAHRADLVHRDLKPSNVFLAQRDDEEVVKLLDFGVVKNALHRESDETASGVLLGTPQYMSPEQARGHKTIDQRADLWSLAVISYEMLTGENPFDSEALAVGDIVIRVCVEPILPPSVVNPQLSPQIDEFFEVALQRDPDLRFQSVDELTEAFMLAADLSFAGLDERSTGKNLPLVTLRPMSIPPLGRQEDTAGGEAASSAGAHPRNEPIDDASTEGSSSMATSLEDRVGKQGRRAVVGVAIAAVSVGVGFASHALLGSSAPATPAAAPSASRPAGSMNTTATATLPPPTESARPEPPEALAREPSGDAADPVPPPLPDASPAPSSDASAVPTSSASVPTSSPNEGGGPPNWFRTPTEPEAKEPAELQPSTGSAGGPER